MLPKPVRVLNLCNLKLRKLLIFNEAILTFMGSFDLRERTRIGTMDRGGVSAERRILGGLEMAALCRAAAMSRFMERGKVPSALIYS